MEDNVEVRDPEAAFAPPDQKGMAAAVTLTASISSNRQIVLQTYLDRDANVSVFHEVLDKFSKAIERQEAKSNLEENLANLAVEELQFKNAKEDYANIEPRSQKLWEDRGKRGPWKLGNDEAMQKQTAKITIDRFGQAIDKRKAEIRKLQAVIAEGD